jgi:anti-sigma regulatory factor (Ser/Thr protein kinase)
MERRFARSLDSTPAIFGFVDEFLEAEGLSPDSGYDLQLLLEELFTNMVRHAKGGRDHVLFVMERDGEYVTMRLSDFDVDPFDPRKTPEVDITAPIEGRRAGGLGIHLVKRIADHIDYNYRDRISTITVVVGVDR